MAKKALLILVGLALFAYILLKIDLTATWTILKGADVPLCLAFLGAALVMVFLKGVRWSFLLRMQGYAYSAWNGFLVYMSSLYWGNITPGRAGDFIKILYLKQDLKMSSGFGMSSVLVDRIFDLYVMLVLGGVGLMTNAEALLDSAPDSTLPKLVRIFFWVLALASLLVFNRRVGEMLMKSFFLMGPRFKERSGQAFQEFHRGMESFYRPSIVVPVLLTVLGYLIFFWGCVLLARAIGLEIGIGYMAFTISVVNIVSLLSLLGMGTREGALIILFGLISLSREQAFAYSMLFLFLGAIIFTGICFACFLLKPIRWKDPAA